MRSLINTRMTVRFELSVLSLAFLKVRITSLSTKMNRSQENREYTKNQIYLAE